MKMDYVLEGDHLIVGNKELITAELKLSTGKVKRGENYLIMGWTA